MLIVYNRILESKNTIPESFLYERKAENTLKKINKWEIFELAFYGKADGNPYVDDHVKAVFISEKETKEVDGFYTGEGVYKVRFMPSYEGIYHYEVQGDCLHSHPASDSLSGEFEAVENLPGNHGPVRVHDGVYLAYEDKTPYHSVGTTCYAWIHQPESLQEQTLETLRNSCFNKIRFCIFPKYYHYNEKEPVTYPYKRGQQKGQDPEKIARKIQISFPTDIIPEDITDFDCYVFQEEHFQIIDKRIAELKEMGIEADIILFHPYDKWGFCTMKQECNELYLNYMAARYGAYSNVWWSLANEYDLIASIGPEEWDVYGQLIRAKDPYHHLTSIHNCMSYYDYTKDWITHCSMQRIDQYKSTEETEQHMEKYKKPVVWDEVGYEGNLDMVWGNLSGQELVRRFWESVLRGGCAGHGETYVNPDDILWWSHGGSLHGDSEPRIAFLKKIWDEVPGGYLKYAETFGDVTAIKKDEKKISSWTETTWCSYELHYYGASRPSFQIFNLPEGENYQIDIIDTWNMTVHDAGIHSGQTRIELAGHEWMALRLKKINDKASC